MTPHHAVELAFRLVAYTTLGLTLETLFAAGGIDLCLGRGAQVPRRVPRRYLEGFVSVYMVPLHGLGMLFAFEPAAALLAQAHWIARFVFWAVTISLAEAAYGWLLRKAVGFHPWDYYKASRFRVFAEGYTLWTLVPLWGVVGLVMQAYSGLLVRLSPVVADYVLG